MLKRLRVDNFKSLINVVFEPDHVNLLTGRNNSGKTTLCQAINFLRLSTYHPIAEAAKIATNDIWNLTNAYFKKDTITYECDCDLLLENELYRYSYHLNIRANPQLVIGVSGRECSVEEESLSVSGGKFETETLLLENLNGNIRLLNEGKFFNNENNVYLETSAATDTTMLNRLYDVQHNKYANAFKKYVASWLYYDFDPASLRSNEANSSGLILNQDGSNLSYVLFKLKNYDERRYRAFVDIIQDIEPKLEALNFIPPTQESVLMSLTDYQNNRFNVWSSSNGTLRFMAMVYVILMSTSTTEISMSPPPLVIIEEPENGVYVGHLKRLMELLGSSKDAKDYPQFIFSSHSPYFIDLFDRYLGGVFVMKSDKTHSEVIKPDSTRLESILQDFELGEAHFRELIG